MKRFLLFLICCFAIHSGSAQYIFKDGDLPRSVSLLKHAEIADAGNKDLSIDDVRKGKAQLSYRALSGNFGNLGFTKNTFWIRFQLRNDLDIPLTHYLETAEPVTDNTNWYLFNQDGKMEIQKSGDKLGFSERAVDNRKTLFVIRLQPHEQKQAFIEIKNDGEKNTLPLLLHSQEELLFKTYHEQLLFGVFYGILFTIAFTYLFFFVALREITFLYYSLYVVFTGLCHSALDGYFHQYIVRGNNWFNLHAVLIFAIAGCYFFGKYSEIVLQVKARTPLIHKVLKLLYFLLGMSLLVTILLPSHVHQIYPLVNMLTLSGMLLIVSAIITMLVRGIKIDRFYASGITVLFICFTIVILLNFGYSYHTIFLDNLTKMGIALELVALSLSMANRIRLLKSKKEELQYVALQRSREMNDVKTQFLSNMSHELRTPLNAIIGLTQLMENEIQDQKLRGNFEMIKQASSNLISSVNDILDFSKIEKGELKLEYAAFSPSGVFRAVQKRFAAQAHDKGLIFEFRSSLGDDVLVIGDAARLDQILNNLLNNAIKFTSKGRILFLVDATMNENNEVKMVMTIEDTGEGIPPEKLETVFHMFSQVEVDNKRRFGGFGIGLCVVKALVELHNGEISLESKVGQGSTCKVDLLYLQSKTKVKPKSIFPADRYDLLNKKILVVEDNPMNQMVLKMMLSKWENTAVKFAADGLAGLEAMRQEEFDIVLMDLQMPVMDGYEAIIAIRDGLAGEKYRDITIITLTADLMQETKERVFDIGANDYMTKPVDQQLLYERITSHLSRV